LRIYVLEGGAFASSDGRTWLVLIFQILGWLVLVAATVAIARRFGLFAGGQSASTEASDVLWLDTPVQTDPR
jgi:hypothetical protein